MGSLGNNPAVTDRQRSSIGHTPARSLGDHTSQTAGMSRFEAISGVRLGSRVLWMGENHMVPGARSGDHHHGDSETGIYVVRGCPVFVYFDGQTDRRVETGPGDYIYVPPFLPHREENPGGQEAVVVLARSTQEAIVVNLPDLRS